MGVRNEVVNELKKYTVGKKNTDKVEINVLALNRLIFALEQESQWTPISEGYPNVEDAYKSFFVTDIKGKVSIQKFYITLRK